MTLTPGAQAPSPAPFVWAVPAAHARGTWDARLWAMTKEQLPKRNPATRKDPETAPSAPSRGVGAGAGDEVRGKKPATDEGQPKWPGGGPKGEDEPEPKQSPN